MQNEDAMDIKTIGKYCTKAKKAWTNNKKVALKTNAMSDIERARASNDEVLAKLVIEKEGLDKKIVARVDHIVGLERDDANDLNVILILETALHTLEASHGLHASDKEDLSDAFQIDNLAIIGQLRKLVEIN
jgi:hypothetical protein